MAFSAGKLFPELFDSFLDKAVLDKVFFLSESRR